MKHHKNLYWPALVLALVLILAVSVFVAACGDEEESTTTAPAESTTTAAPDTTAAPTTTAAPETTTTVAQSDLHTGFDYLHSGLGPLRRPHPGVQQGLPAVHGEGRRGG